MTIVLSANNFSIKPGIDGILRSTDPTGSLTGGISTVTGTVAEGQTLSISGAAFGLKKPANYIFEDFSAGTLGVDGTTANTNFDTTSTYWPFKFVSDSRSGSLAAEMAQFKNIAPNNFAASINGFNLGTTTEVFTSYSIKVPTGAYFPGTDGGNAGTNSDYSTDSSWKTAWLFSDNTADNDLVIATHVGSGIWHTAGNDLGVIRNHGANPTWWKWGAWNRISSWVKAGAIPQTDAGNFYFQVANGTDAITEVSDTPVIFANGTAPYDFKAINFCGWMRDSAGAGISTLYDDIYVAWGDSACARIELGNASTYAACTDLAICEPLTWNDTTITAKVRSGGLNLAGATWLYVTLPDNTTRYSYKVV